MTKAPKQPAKTRLTAATRDALIAYARNILNDRYVKKFAKLEKQERALWEAVLAAAAKKVPAADMETLRKYKCTVTHDWFDLVCETGWARGGVHLPHRLTFEYPDNVGRPRLVFTPKQVDMYEQYAKERQDVEQEKVDKFNDYKSLLQSARYIEDVLHVWPAAAKGIPERVSVPMVLGEDLIARIRSYEEAA